jgi:hypothetical protein
LAFSLRRVENWRKRAERYRHLAKARRPADKPLDSVLSKNNILDVRLGALPGAGTVLREW